MKTPKGGLKKENQKKKPEMAPEQQMTHLLSEGEPAQGEEAGSSVLSPPLMG